MHKGPRADACGAPGSGAAGSAGLGGGHQDLTLPKVCWCPGRPTLEPDQRGLVLFSVDVS